MTVPRYLIQCIFCQHLRSDETGVAFRVCYMFPTEVEVSKKAAVSTAVQDPSCYLPALFHHGWHGPGNNPDCRWCSRNKGSKPAPGFHGGGDSLDGDHISRSTKIGFVFFSHGVDFLIGVDHHVLQLSVYFFFGPIVIH